MQKKIISAVLVVACFVVFCFGDNTSFAKATDNNIREILLNDDSSNISFSNITLSESDIKQENAVKGISPYSIAQNQTLDESMYLYRSTMSELEKECYDKVVSGLQLGSEKIYFAQKPTDSNTLDADVMMDLLAQVMFDHPEFFWCELNFKIASFTNSKVAYIMPTYNDLKNDVEENKVLINTELAPLFTVLNNIEKEIDKVKYVHDYITHTVDYDLDSNYNQTLYSSVINKSSVCSGYAKMFQYILNNIGIKCTYVSGYANGGGHAWNILELDGEYYAMDVTWDDPILVDSDGNQYTNPDYYSYKYFNVTDSFMVEKSHIRESYSEVIPTAEGTVYSYANYYNNNAYGSDFSELDKLINGETENATTAEDNAEETNASTESFETNSQITTAITTESNITETNNSVTTENRETESNISTTTENTTTETEASSATESSTTKVEVASTTENKTIVQQTTNNVEPIYSEQVTTKVDNFKPKMSTPQLSSITLKKKSLKVKWKKQSGVSGYEIQYSTNKKFKNAKTKIVKKPKKTSLTIKKLKANKKYYVRIRAYKIIGKKKYRSKWSKVKTKRTK